MGQPRQQASCHHSHTEPRELGRERGLVRVSETAATSLPSHRPFSVREARIAQQTAVASSPPTDHVRMHPSTHLSPVPLFRAAFDSARPPPASTTTLIPSAMSRLSEHCAALAAPNPFATTLAAFLVVGILVSYFPQHAKIIQRRTSEGLSPWWVLLGGLSSIAAIGNILTLPASRADIGCCKELGAPECAAALFGRCSNRLPVDLLHVHVSSYLAALA